MSWTSDIHTELPIQVFDNIFPITVPQMFHQTAKKYSNHISVSWRIEKNYIKNKLPSYYQLANTVDSKWDNMTWAQLEEQVYIFGGACIASGLNSKDVAIIMGFNSPQWLIAFHGTIQAGGVVAGSYLTNKTDTCKYLVNNSNAKLAFVESWKQGIKFLDDLEDSNSSLVKIIVWNMDENLEDEIKQLNNSNIISFKEFMDLAPKLDKCIENVGKTESLLKPGECCDLIYTSGTTGNPKGVMLSHDNLTWDVSASVALIKKYTNSNMGQEQVFLSYLPLSHIAAQMLDIIFSCYTGGSIWFATPDALKGGLLPLLQQVRPTLFFGVPRVWEKIMDSIKAKSAENSSIKKKIGNMAKYVGLAVNMNLANTAGNSRGLFYYLGIYSLFNKIVYKKLKILLGLDRCAFFGSGAAPISPDTLSFFWSLNIPIVEGFGMSETSGISSMCLFPKQIRIGYSGMEISDGLVKIGENGEILLRGRNIMMGYLNNSEKNIETFTSNRYLKTGDIGILEKSPFGDVNLLKITGRIKELIITAGGENIAPVPIENTIKTACPLISNVILIGDKRKFLSILVTLRVVIDPDTMVASNELDNNCLIELKKLGSDSKTVEEAKNEDIIHQAIQKSVDYYNNNAVSNAQKVQKYVILDSDFTIAGGELTGTQKIKRNIILEKYETEIEDMYK